MNDIDLLEEEIRRREEAADYDCYNEEQMEASGRYERIAGWLRECKDRREKDHV